jgi:putative iron-dependent peroxidase
MPKSDPQSVILPEPGESALFLIMRLADAGAAARVADAAARLPALTKKLDKRASRVRLASGVAFGADFWDTVSPGARPRGLRDFRPLEAGARRAPATGGDLLLHVTAKRQDLCFELAQRLRVELGDAVDVLEEVHGFRYLDLRDLTGFIDGTENPTGKARARVALIGEDDKKFAGGSYVFTQRYVHDLAKWDTVAVRDQERVIGRRKRDSKELSKQAKPPTAHISRVVIHEDGEELEILRHSFPYGTTSEKGLFFIAYTSDLDLPEKMLRRMIGASGDGLHDHLLEYTRAVSGANFFAPSLRVLRGLRSKS